MKLKKYCGGFTLIELLIGIALSSLIFLGSSSLVFSVFASNAKVRQLDLIEQAKSDLTIELNNNLRWAQAISISADFHTLTIASADGKTAIYSLQNGAVIKNGQPLTPKNISVTDFTIQDYSLQSTSAEKSLLISITLQNAQFNAVADTLKIVVSQRFGSIPNTSL
jgi:prepilin-type N-terminal cleavage/methylation domain-containing protein